MRILGIDYGDRRIGIAVSDPMKIIATGLETVQNTGDMQQVVDIMIQHIKTYDVDTVVVGMPKNMNNSMGFRSEATQTFLSALQEAISATEDIKTQRTNVVTWDERLTSVQATRTMHDMGMKRKQKQKKGTVDKIAAVIILQGYLDSLGTNRKQEEY